MNHVDGGGRFSRGLQFSMRILIGGERDLRQKQKTNDVSFAKCDACSNDISRIEDPLPWIDLEETWRGNCFNKSDWDGDEKLKFDELDFRVSVPQKNMLIVPQNRSSSHTNHIFPIYVVPVTERERRVGRMKLGKNRRATMAAGVEGGKVSGAGDQKQQRWVWVTRSELRRWWRGQNLQNYIKLEESCCDPARVQVLYERAVTDFPVSTDLWLAYTSYVDRTLKVSNIVKDVYSRATRNCTWMGELWVNYMLALERMSASEKEQSTVGTFIHISV
ncbi:hypothetical protein KSP40_PGU005088 [Platanthera guangdongensis]|uniref:Uncharacterized protein n=1 Tax=Platanthera guangdongensis TaxID=2320717 RepID=A0ABR2M9R7_9ASPA